MKTSLTLIAEKAFTFYPLRISLGGGGNKFFAFQAQMKKVKQQEEINKAKKDIKNMIYVVPVETVESKAGSVHLLEINC